MTSEPLWTAPSGVIVTPQNAGLILTRYINSFGFDPDKFSLSTRYTTTSVPTTVGLNARPNGEKKRIPQQPDVFHCTAVMPPGLKVTSISSATQGFRSKALARQSAYTNMIKELLHVGELDDNLMPLPNGKPPPAKEPKKREVWIQGKVLETGTEYSNGSRSNESTTKRWSDFKARIKERLPPAPGTGKNGVSGVSDHPFISTASFWRESPIFTSKNLHSTLIQLTINNATEDMRPMCILTSRPLPLSEDGEMMIDLTQGEIGPDKKRADAQARLIYGGKLKELADGQLELIFRYTQRILRAQLQKAIVIDKERCRWLMIPLLKDCKIGKKGERVVKIKRKHIDWEEIQMVAKSITIPFDLENLAELYLQAEDGVATINAEFAKRYNILQVRSDLTTQSPHPLHPDKTILQFATGDYHMNLEAEGKSDWPKYILECQVLSPAKSGGYISDLVVDSPTEFLIPNITHRHTISASTFRSSSTIPSIMVTINNLLIARQLSDNIFDGKITTSLASQALTTPVSVHASQVDQSYERLEFLGDTLLKLLTTIDMYMGPDADEVDEQVQVERHLILSNRGLQVSAIAAGVTPYIRSSFLKLKNWVPEGWTLEAAADPAESAQNDSETHAIGGKMIADVAEALIGAAYLSSSRSLDAALEAIYKLHIPLKNIKSWPIGKTESLSTKSKKRKQRPDEESSKPVNIDGESWMKAFKPSSPKYFGYEFRDEQRPKDILAMTGDHRRRLAVQKYHLFGDCLLEYMTVEYLWDKYPQLGPGPLTHMKHSRMGDLSLAALCVTSGLSDKVTDIPAELDPMIKTYRKEIKKAKVKVDKMIARLESHQKNGAAGNVDTKDDEHETKEWWTNIPGAFYLGEIPESFLGAIFADSNYDIDLIRSIFRTHFLPHFETYCIGLHEGVVHPKAVLIQLLSQKGCRKYLIEKGAFSEEVKGEYEGRVLLHDQVVEKNHSSSVDVAVRKACASVVKRIENEPKWLDSVCDCPSKKIEPKVEGEHDSG